MKRIVIVGAGLSGLSLAFRLRQRGAEVTVLEASPRAGGNIGTYQEEGYTWEAGPNGFLDSKPSTLQLARDLGLNPISASEASRKNRYLCLNGKLIKLPGSPLGLLTTQALGWKGKLALLCEPLRDRGDCTNETVHQFAKRRLGYEAATTIMDALVTGIHGGDPKELSLPAAFPRLAMFERTYGSLFQGVRRSYREKKAKAQAEGLPPPTAPKMWSFPNGMQELINALTLHLGDAVKLCTPVVKLETINGRWAVHADKPYFADSVVLTVPAHVQAQLLTPLDLGFAEFHSIRTVPIAVVVLGYRDASNPDGFGYLSPQNQQRDVLGVQWCSSIFPARAPRGHVLWRALCGGAHRADMTTLDDATLAERVHQEMRTLLPVRGEPVFVRIQRWPRAIPQYTLGHLDRVARLDATAAKYPGLTLAGNSLHGVAINDCTEQAETLAARILL